jgi:hypothetical protein
MTRKVIEPQSVQNDEYRKISGAKTRVEST